MYNPSQPTAKQGLLCSLQNGEVRVPSESRLGDHAAECHHCEAAVLKLRRLVLIDHGATVFAQDQGIECVVTGVSVGCVQQQKEGWR